MVAYFVMFFFPVAAFCTLAFAFARSSLSPFETVVSLLFLFFFLLQFCFCFFLVFVGLVFGFGRESLVRFSLVVCRVSRSAHQPAALA